MYPQEPEHPFFFFLSAFSLKILCYTHAYIKLLKDRGSIYKLAMFSLLMPPCMETNSERPLKVVSLKVTEKVRVREEETERVGHSYSKIVDFEP